MISFKNTLFIILCLLFCLPNIAAQQNDNPKTANNSDKKHVANPKKLTIQAPIAKALLYKKDLSHYLNLQKLTPILVGNDEVITLIKEDTTGSPKGVVILLPNWQQIATAPHAINYLQNKFPQQGWTTITIQPPSKPINYPSTKLKKRAQREENQQTLTNYKKTLRAIINKVMTKAKNYPGIFVVVAEGSNAALLVDLYQQNKNIHPAALVILSGHLLTPEDNQHFAQTLAQLSLPVLDLYLVKDNEQSIYYAPLRLAQSKRQLKVYYQQNQLQNFNSGYYPQITLRKTISGWLKRIGW